MGYAKSDPEGFAKYLEGAPSLASASTMTGAPQGSATVLTPEEIAMCKSTGLSEKEFLETKKQESAE